MLLKNLDSPKHANWNDVNDIIKMGEKNQSKHEQCKNVWQMFPVLRFCQLLRFIFKVSSLKPMDFPI